MIVLTRLGRDAGRLAGALGGRRGYVTKDQIAGDLVRAILDAAQRERSVGYPSAAMLPVFAVIHVLLCGRASSA